MWGQCVKTVGWPLVKSVGRSFKARGVLVGTHNQPALMPNQWSQKYGLCACFGGVDSIFDLTFTVDH